MLDSKQRHRLKDNTLMDGDKAGLKLQLTGEKMRCEVIDHSCSTDGRHLEHL